MWSGDALVDATVLGETPRFLGPVVGALAVVALNELALRFVLYHNLVPGVLFVMIVIMRRLGFTTRADLCSSAKGRPTQGCTASRKEVTSGNTRTPRVVQVGVNPIRRRNDCG
jgi:hypothetical protein